MGADGRRRDVRSEVFPTEGLWDDDDDEKKSKAGEGESDQKLVIEVYSTKCS